jgi:hypothetical protein
MGVAAPSTEGEFTFAYMELLLGSNCLNLVCRRRPRNVGVQLEDTHLESTRDSFYPILFLAISHEQPVLRALHQPFAACAIPRHSEPQSHVRKPP